jgi:hypothetical protein
MGSEFFSVARASGDPASSSRGYQGGDPTGEAASEEQPLTRLQRARDRRLITEKDSSAPIQPQSVRSTDARESDQIIDPRSPSMDAWSGASTPHRPSHSPPQDHPSGTNDPVRGEVEKSNSERSPSESLYRIEVVMDDQT